MVILKCKMCGGDIQVNEQSYGTCDSCGSTMTLPRIDEEKKANLYNRANHFRLQNDFDKALQAYENILNEDSKDSEAYWGCVLSRNGIEYVKDPSTYEMVPTCNRVQTKSILSDTDYLAALKYAPDSYSRSLYETEAEKISQIQKSILAISNKVEPYDIFICYKETSASGTRTEDSVFAQDIYYSLTKEGYKVFFSKISLEDKLGHQYEPYIYAALNSAKIMLTISTSSENINSAWVKNEWSRYLKIKEKDNSRIIIPCFAKMNPYDLPEELSIFQSLDMSKIGFMQDLTYSIKKILTPLSSAEKTKPDEIKPKVQETQTVQTEPLGPTVDSLYQRAVMFLEDGNFLSANMYFNKVLDIVPEYAPAYIGKACCYFEKNYESSLVYIEASTLAENPDIKKAIRFADKDYKDKLVELDNKINKYNTEISNKYRKRKQEEKKEERKRKELWRDIVSISAGDNFIVGLKRNGEVVAAGYNYEGECDVYNWEDIEEISASVGFTIGLKKDGTVVAAGEGRNVYGQSNVGDWKDIKAVSAGYWHTAGVRKNDIDSDIQSKGWISRLFNVNKQNSKPIVLTGMYGAGAINSLYKEYDFNSWTDIVSISAGEYFTIGLKKNGTVVAGGLNYDGQCNVDDWKDIIAISAGKHHTIGLKKDGTVVATGNNGEGECNVNDWKDIIAISAGSARTFGVRKDGTVIYVGKDHYLNEEIQEWKDIVAVSTGKWKSGEILVGLKKDGTVVCNRDMWSARMNSRNKDI